MFINLSVLKRNRDYRLLFLGQTISFMGSMISYVAIPYQIYELTKSNLLVGSVSLVQLAAILLFGIAGGAVADRINRRKLMITCELIMMIIMFLFIANAAQSTPSVNIIFILAGLLQSVTSFHRPAMDAMNQSIVSPSDYKSVATLGTFRYAIGAIGGPAIAGFLIATFGFKWAYFVDFIGFFLAFLCLYALKMLVQLKRQKKNLSCLIFQKG